MIRSSSTSMLWRGILAIALGVVSVAWPGITVGAFVILFAVYAFVATITDGARAFSSDKAGPVVGYLLLALISLAAGVIALVWPGLTALALTLCVAIWAFVAGIVQVALGFRENERAGERALWIVSGLVSVALGVVLGLRPDIGAVSLAMVFGLFAIVSGVSSLVLAVQVRHARTSDRRLVGSTL